MFSDFGARPINPADSASADAPGSNPKLTLPPAIADNFKKVRLFVVMPLSDTEALVNLVRYAQHFHFVSRSNADGLERKRPRLHVLGNRDGCAPSLKRFCVSET
jgi:hypothetical protein